MEALAEKLKDFGEVSVNPYLIRATISESDSESDFVLTLFSDGRAIIQGTEEESVARSVYAKYVGH